MKTTEMVITIIGAIITVALLAVLKFDFKMTLFALISLLLLLVSIMNIQYAIIFLLLSRSSMDTLGEASLPVPFLSSSSLNVSSLLAVYAIAVIIGYMVTNRIYITNNVAKSYYAFITISVITALVPHNYHFGLVYIIKFISMLCVYLIVYILCTYIDKFDQTILKTTIASSIIPLGVGLYQFIYGKGQAMHLINVENESRVQGTFVHPNVFAFFLLIIIASSIIYLMKSNNKNLWVYPVMALSVFELYLTYTRGAWLGLGLMVILYLIFSKHPLRYKMMIGSLLMVMVLSFFGQLAERFNNLFSSRMEESSLATRLYIWKGMIDLFFNRPLLGYGIGSFKSLSTSVLNWDIEAHNDYLKLLIETGIIGLVSYVVLQWNALLDILKRQNRNYLMALIFFLIFCLLSVFDNIIDMTVCQWYIWAIVAIFTREEKHEPDSLKM